MQLIGTDIQNQKTLQGHFKCLLLRPKTTYTAFQLTRTQTNSYLANPYPSQLVPKSTRTQYHLVPKPTCTHVNPYPSQPVPNTISYPNQVIPSQPVPKSTRTQYHLVPTPTRTQVNSYPIPSRTHTNSYPSQLVPKSDVNDDCSAQIK